MLMRESSFSTVIKVVASSKEKGFWQKKEKEGDFRGVREEEIRKIICQSVNHSVNERQVRHVEAVIASIEKDPITIPQ